MNDHTDQPYRRKRKITLLVGETVLERVRGAVEAGQAASQGALVEEAVTEYFARREREALREEYRDAASDPAFLADVDRVMRDFEPADAEVDQA